MIYIGKYKIYLRKFGKMKEEVTWLKKIIGKR